jgi:hypothetical protein
MAPKRNTPKKAPLLEKTDHVLLMIDTAKNKGRLFVRLIAEGKWHEWRRARRVIRTA